MSHGFAFKKKLLILRCIHLTFEFFPNCLGLCTGLCDFNNIFHLGSGES